MDSGTATVGSCAVPLYVVKHTVDLCTVTVPSGTATADSSAVLLLVIGSGTVRFLYRSIGFLYHYSAFWYIYCRSLCCSIVFGPDTVYFCIFTMISGTATANSCTVPLVLGTAPLDFRLFHCILVQIQCFPIPFWWILVQLQWITVLFHWIPVQFSVASCTIPLIACTVTLVLVFGYSYSDYLGCPIKYLYSYSLVASCTTTVD